MARVAQVQVVREETHNSGPRSSGQILASNDNELTAANDNHTFASKVVSQNITPQTNTPNRGMRKVEVELGRVPKITQNTGQAGPKATYLAGSRIGVAKKVTSDSSTPIQKKALSIAKQLPGPAGKVIGASSGVMSKMWERRKVTRANVSIFSSGFSFWFSVHLPLAVLSVAFLGLAYARESIQATIEAQATAVVGETAANFIGTIYEYTIGAGINGLDKIFEVVFGFSLLTIGDPATWFTTTWLLVIIFGWMSLLLAIFVYVGFMVNPFFGKGWKWKIGGFLVAASGYLIPGLNILPWFAVYSACIWMNPE